MLDNRYYSFDEIIASLISALRKYNGLLIDADTRYSDMAAIVEQSLSESQAFWKKFEQDERTSSGAQASQTIEGIEVTLTRMRNILAELAEKDKAFANYYRKHQSEVSLIEADLNAGDDYLQIVRSLCDRLHSLANECARSVKSFPFSEIDIFLSNKRKNAYAELMKLYSQAEQIADIACAVLPSKTMNYWKAVEKGRDEEIEEAEEESLVLLESIRQEHIEESRRILNELGGVIERLLPNEAVLRIGSLMDEDNTRLCQADPTFIPSIQIGFFAFDFAASDYRDDAMSVLLSKAESIVEDSLMVVPATIESRRAQNIMICANSFGLEREAKDVVVSIALSLLRNRPVGLQRFIFIDPEERAKGFKVILDFISKFPGIMGERVLTTRQQISDNLSRIVEHVDAFSQRQLSNYSDIYEYNVNIPEKPEPYITLVFMDFPKYFDEQMLEMLWNIINSKGVQGVGVILQLNQEYIDERGSENYTALLNKIMNNIDIIEEHNSRWRSKYGITFVPLSYTANAISEITDSYSQRYEESLAQGILINRIIDSENIGEGCSTNCLSVPFAIDETGQIKSIELGDTVAAGLSHYALVTGATGSGKSTFLHTVIMSSILKYSPDELNIYLMDFKQGTEFKIYAEKRVPHIKLLAMDAMQEFGESILFELCNEMKHRSTVFREAAQSLGKDIKNIAQYRTYTGRSMPRILVILDEFQRLFDAESNRKVALSCGKMIADLISLARVYGIHLIMATQTLSRLYSGDFTITKATLTEMHVRIGFRSNENEADLLFGSLYGKSAYYKIGEEKGSGAYMEDDTVGNPIGFRCALCPEELQMDLLDDIIEMYQQTDNNMRVFTGSSIPKIEESKAFNAQKIKNCFLLGEPIKIGDDLAIQFSEKHRSNLLIVGAQTEIITRLLNLSMISYSRFFIGRPTFYYVEGLAIIGDSIPDSTQKLIDSISNIHCIRSNREFLETIQELYNEMVDRKKKATISSSDMIILYINNMQWIESLSRLLQGKSIDGFRDRELTPSVTSGNDSEIEDGLTELFSSFNTAVMGEDDHSNIGIDYRNMFFDLLEYGYIYGICIAMSCSDFTSIKESLYDIGPKFTERVIFSLSDNDADRLIPEVKIQVLPENTAYYSNGINLSFQFKPFSHGEVEAKKPV